MTYHLDSNRITLIPEYKDSIFVGMNIADDSEMFKREGPFRVASVLRDY